VNKLLNLQPTFKEIGRDLIQRLLYSGENTEMVYEGLQKAGLIEFE
jgi:hypothetical protein